MKHARILFTLLAALGLAACRSVAAEKPIPPVSHVNLARYMGRWYVIAAIPTDVERDDYNPVETYRREPDGSICTLFRFRNGSFTAPLKTIHSTATVLAHTGHAVWHVHLYWFLRLQYIIAWLSPNDSRVIVARDARDYVWLMARTPHISQQDYRAMVARVAAMGYDVAKLRKSPQRWPEPGGARPPLAGQCH